MLPGLEKQVGAPGTLAAKAQVILKSPGPWQRGPMRGIMTSRLEGGATCALPLAWASHAMPLMQPPDETGL